MTGSETRYNRFDPARRSDMIRKFLVGSVLTVFMAWLTEPAQPGSGLRPSFNSQIGEQRYAWDLTADGAKLTGKYTSSNGNREIAEGKVSGDELSGDELKLTRKVTDVAIKEAVTRQSSSHVKSKNLAGRAWICMHFTQGAIRVP
jgi:hypothetical protein